MLASCQLCGRRSIVSAARNGVTCGSAASRQGASPAPRAAGALSPFACGAADPGAAPRSRVLPRPALTPHVTRCLSLSTGADARTRRCPVALSASRTRGAARLLGVLRGRGAAPRAAPLQSPTPPRATRRRAGAGARLDPLPREAHPGGPALPPEMRATPRASPTGRAPPAQPLLPGAHAGCSPPPRGSPCAPGRARRGAAPRGP